MKLLKKGLFHEIFDMRETFSFFRTVLCFFMKLVRKPKRLTYLPLTGKIWISKYLFLFTVDSNQLRVLRRKKRNLQVWSVPIQRIHKI